MVVDQDWLLAQAIAESQGAAEREGGLWEVPSTPHPAGPSSSPSAWDKSSFSEIQPGSPLRGPAAWEGAAGPSSSSRAAGDERPGSSTVGASSGRGGGGGGGSATAAGGLPRLRVGLGGLMIQKHLVFNDDQAETAFRLHMACCGWLGELSLVGLQLVGWLAAVGRAGKIHAMHIVARVTLMALLPSLAHLYLILYRPAAYRSRGPCFSLLLRAPFDAWLVFTQDAPVLGIGGAVIHRGLPHNAKLLLVVFFQFYMATLLCSKPFVWSFAYSTALLALWMQRHINSAGLLMTAALLAAYAAPLVQLYRREVEERTAFAVRRLGLSAEAGPGEKASEVRRLRAWVDASLLGVGEFLLPAMIYICWACL